MNKNQKIFLFLQFKHLLIKKTQVIGNIEKKTAIHFIIIKKFIYLIKFLNNY